MTTCELWIGGLLIFGLTITCLLIMVLTDFNNYFKKTDTEILRDFRREYKKLSDETDRLKTELNYYKYVKSIRPRT